MHVFQTTVHFVFVYNNKAVYEHEKTANLQLTDVTGGFQLSLHAANANSQRTVFTINMPPSFLLWWIVHAYFFKAQLNKEYISIEPIGKYNFA